MINDKELIREVVTAYLREAAPIQVSSFDAAYDDLYAMAQSHPHQAQGSNVTADEGLGLTVEQLADSTLIVMALSTAKALLGFALKCWAEKKVLPNLAEWEQMMSQRLGHPDLVRGIRIRLERGLRKRLGLPPQDDTK